MLVLSRREDQSLIIDHRIVVMVIEIRGDSVRLGVEAPKEIAVHRNEIEERIRAAESMESPDTEQRQNALALCPGLPIVPEANQTSGSGI